MDFDPVEQARLAERLRRALPLSAHARPALLAFLRARRLIGGVSPRLKVVSVFQTGQPGDVMCGFTIEDAGYDETFIAPLAQLALGRERSASLGGRSA